MTRAELEEMIRNGEGSGVEFKLDEVESHDLAKEIVAFANFSGGVILLGVADDGAIRGTRREGLETWVMEICRGKVDPPIIPYFEWYRGLEQGRDIAVIRVLSGLDKPYARLHNNRRSYFVRVGSTSREASRDELARMFQASGQLRYGTKPVPGALLSDLDKRRLGDYFGRILSQTCPEDQDTQGWSNLLTNLELMVTAGQTAVPAVDGMLLFGLNPKRFLPQAGIRCIAYPGEKADYGALADTELKRAMVSLYARDGSLYENGLVEQSLEFVNAHTGVRSVLRGGARVDVRDYPPEVLREVIVNALVHRDYSVAGTDIMLSIYSDRLEVISPGRLPNTATVEALKAGFRYARNQTLVNVMRDYRYVEFRGMGIRDKVIPGMLAHNGTEPEFIETDWSFTVRLWKEPRQ